MSLNEVNLSCTPMYNQSISNQVMGYFCSSKNIENFKVSKPGSGPIMLYDNTVTYKEGDVVVKDTKLYFANDGAGSPGYAPGASGIWTSLEWNKDTFYLLNDRVSYNGKIYKVKDQATGNGAKGYEPSTKTNVWMVVG